MEHHVYILPGNPIPLARPRFSRNSHVVWDPQKQNKHKAIIYIEAQRDQDIFTFQSLHLITTFFFLLPKSKKKTNPEYHTSKPDIDNLIKFICDVCSNGLLYTDDCIIAKITATKTYTTENPRTEFYFEEL